MGIPRSRTVEAVLVDVTLDGPDLKLRFEPTRGDRTPVEDRTRLGPRGDLGAIHGVGRVLRILRAARVRPPEDPYALQENPEEAAALLQRCVGARLLLHLARRVERVLTVWTDGGVDRIGGVVDFGEDADGLWVRRTGGGSQLRIPRTSLIRFSCDSHERPEIVSVEIPGRRELP